MLRVFTIRVAPPFVLPAQIRSTFRSHGTASLRSFSSSWVVPMQQHRRPLADPENSAESVGCTAYDQVFRLVTGPLKKKSSCLNWCAYLCCPPLLFLCLHAAVCLIVTPLQRQVRKHGTQWALIANWMPHRSDHSLKNRWVGHQPHLNSFVLHHAVWSSVMRQVLRGSQTFGAIQAEAW
jgi:hypothetical protein